MTDSQPASHPASHVAVAITLNAKASSLITIPKVDQLKTRMRIANLKNNIIIHILSKYYCCRSNNVSSFVHNGYNLNLGNSFAPLTGISDDYPASQHEVVSSIKLFEPRLHSSPVGQSTRFSPVGQSRTKVQRMREHTCFPQSENYCGECQ